MHACRVGNSTHIFTNNDYMKIITSTFYQNIKFSIKKLHFVSLNLSSRYMRFIELSIDLLTFIALVIYHNILILHNSYIAKQLLNS
jgi:hypothetical protein